MGEDVMSSNEKKRSASEERWHAHGAPDMKPIADNLLSTAGRWMIGNVRERALADLSNIIEGRAKGVAGREFSSRFASPDGDLRVKLHWLAGQVVDTLLHHLMSAIEESDDMVFGIRDAEGQIQELKEWSDGLAGDLLGWIDKFAKKY
jgi:hypothetical protein